MVPINECESLPAAPCAVPAVWNNFTRRVVEQSLFLYERLPAAGMRSTSTPQARAEAAERLNQWRRSVASGDDRLFANRLRFDGLDSGDAARLMEAALPENASVPAWGMLLDSVRQRMEAVAGDDWERLSAAAGITDDHAGFGFDQLLGTFVEYARNELVRRNLPAWRLLQDTAVGDLDRSLACRLSLLARETLMFEFSVWTAVAGPRWWSSSPAGDGAHRAFVREHLRDGCATLFVLYPVLARLLAECTQKWIHFVALVLERLHNNRSDIAGLLLSSGSLGPIARIDTNMGDLHRGGQTVVIFQLANAARFIYKPKPLDSDREFANLVAWLNERTSIPLKSIPTLCRPDYGWQQYIEVLPCPHQKAVQDYFRRAGMLLCLMYVFGGSDCHHENMLAHGEYPMLVDLETFLCPEIPSIDGTGAEEHASSLASHNFFSDSVHRTGMLPCWDAGPDGALSRAPGGLATRDSVVRPSAVNAVYCGGELMSADDFVEDVVHGFSEVYGILAANRAAILREERGEIMPDRSRITLRYVYRNTRTYAAALARALRPPALRSGMDFSIQLDNLARVMLAFEGIPPHWQIIRAEHEALSCGDIPVFRYGAAHTDLCLESGTIIPEYFRRSSLDVLRQRVESRLGDRDLELQIAYIRTAFQRENVSCEWSAGQKRTDREPGAPYIPGTHTDELLHEAESIGAGVVESAILANDGTASWIARAYDANSRAWQLKPMDLRLYDGLAGPAVFLAALWKATGNERFRKIALGAAENIVQSLGHKTRAELNSLGAGLGVGSLSYALALAAEFLGEERFQQHAVRLARDIKPSVIDADNALDVLSGSAGYVLAVAALRGRGVKDDRLLENAILCGEHLLKRRLPGSSGHRAWPTFRGRLQTGFAHGSAGIAYALAKLFSVTAERHYLDAALEACQYENGHFRESVRNWPSFAEDGSPVLQMRWCYGAPGIGLGRVGMLAAAGAQSFEGAASIHEDIRYALKTTASAPADNLDHLCCGNFGRVELLLTAAEKLGAPGWHEKAVHLASSVLRRARMSGHYAMGTDAQLYLSSFHQGMAGIGYQLLRLARPAQFPPVLLWE